jgi:transposase
MVFEMTEEQGEAYGVVPEVARQLGINQRSLYRLVREAEAEGHGPELAGTERVRLAELERENRELRRANEILKAASAFFAAELDRPESR